MQPRMAINDDARCAGSAREPRGLREHLPQGSAGPRAHYLSEAERDELIRACSRTLDEADTARSGWGRRTVLSNSEPNYSYTLRALDSLDEGLVKPGLTPLAQHKVAQHG
jgi:hypothetical protein